jgi:ribosome-associated translation inhibitor RaiA
MLVQVNTDNSIQGREDVTRFVEGVVASKLKPLAPHISRIEVHLADEAANKHGAKDKRCTVEARLNGRKPTAVTHHDDNLQSAVTRAVDKLRNLLDSDLGKLSDHHR